MLELEWQVRRAAVLEDMDTRDYSMVDTLAEQLRLLDIWMDDKEIGIKELVEERVFEAEVN